MRFHDALSSIRSSIGHGLRDARKDGYDAVALRADLMAGLVVGVVALPLSMALAIAAGVAPQNGLYTAIIAGIIAALAGGSRVQVTGPTAAFVVILLPVVTRHGLGGLLLAGLMAGAIQILMGLMKLGSLMRFIPHPVTTGFTAGIAVVIGTIQIKDFLGLTFEHAPAETFERWEAIASSLGSTQRWEAAIGALTLVLLVIIPRFIRRVPAPLIALTLAALAGVLLEQVVPGLELATIGRRFHTVIDGVVVNGIPPTPPLPRLPWDFAGQGGVSAGLSLELVRALVPAAFAIAMLGAIESLLSAVIADGMTGHRHDPNAELIGTGLANLVCPFFGGIPATGALARTATNIRAGARSPVAAVVHSLFVLLSMVALAPLVSYLPMAALAALLLIVAKNMSEAKHFTHLVRVAPRSDVLVLLTCFGLTVAFDMIVAVGVGIVLAALLFMRRMAELTETKIESSALTAYDTPVGVRVYEIEGPLFFGAAQRAVDVLQRVDDSLTVVILDLSRVPLMDATGMVALQGALASLRKRQLKVVLAGLTAPVRAQLARAEIKREPGLVAFTDDVETALSLAIVHDARRSLSVPQPSDNRK